MKTALRLIIGLAIVGAAGYFFVTYYSYIFAKTVKGEVVGIERVMDPQVVIGNRVNSEQMYSYAVAIKDSLNGEVYTASSEDRKWAVVAKGQCAEARFFKYAPWDLDKGGTYFGARLERQYECK